MYNLKAHLNTRWRLVIDRDACVTFWKKRKIFVRGTFKFCCFDLVLGVPSQIRKRKKTQF